MDIIAIGLGFALLFGAFILIYREHKISKKEVWIIVMEMVQFNIPSIFIAALLSIAVVEALLAAFTHIPGKLTISSPVRVSAHIIFNVIGFVATTALKPLTIQLTQSVLHIKTKYYAVVPNLLLFILMFAIMLIMPFLNLTLTANSIGEVDKLWLFLDKINPTVSINEYYESVARAGYDPATYNAVSNMSNPLLLMNATVIVHLMLSLFLSLMTIGYVISGKGSSQPTNPNPNPNPNPNHDTAPERLFRECISLFVDDANEVSKLVKAAMKVVAPQNGGTALLSPPQVAALTVGLTRHLKSAKDNTLPSDKKQEAETEIIDLLTKAVSAGGLELDIPLEED